jgi:serine/threonine-protein kinase
MKFRRHTPAGSGWFGRVQWPARVTALIGSLSRAQRQILAGGMTLLFTFGLGFAIAAIALFPAPIFARPKEVPRVLGLELAAATEALIDASLTPSDTDYVNHPEAPRGTVVWQDPPPEVAVLEGAGVALQVSRGPQPIPVPDVTGYEQGLAARLIVAAGLRVSRIDTTQAPQERGVVVNTRPTVGQSAMPGDGVRLFVSVGAPTISVPDLIGLTVDEARDLLEQSGLVMGSTRTRRTTARPPGVIFEQQPLPGTLSAPGSAVNVTLVRGDSL